jgi:intein-encoded DNA endonuclease-like protein
VRKDIEAKKIHIIEQYKSGDGVHIISSQYNCHSDVIKRILRENNILLRTPSESQKCRKGEIRRKDLWDNQEEIVNLYLSGSNFEKIGKLFNTSGVQIKLILKQKNIL